MSCIVNRITISKCPNHTFGANETRIEVETQRAILGFLAVADPYMRDRHIPEGAKAHYAEHIARDAAHQIASTLRREIEDVLVRYTPVMQAGDRIVYTRS